jgi:acyl carrier protein
MVPSTFVFVDALPLTPNGKIDWGALPRPGVALRDTALAMPSTSMELVVADAWKRVLGLDTVGVDDNFFDLGGHSLLLARVLTQLRAQVRADLTIVDLFQYPNVGALAAHLDARKPPNEPRGVDRASERAGDRTSHRTKAQREAIQRRGRRPSA